MTIVLRKYFSFLAGVVTGWWLWFISVLFVKKWGFVAGLFIYWFILGTVIFVGIKFGAPIMLRTLLWLQRRQAKKTALVKYQKGGDVTAK